MQNLSNEKDEKLTILANHAAEEDGDQSFMNPVKPKKRGRPPGSKKKENKAEPEQTEAYGTEIDPQKQIDALKPIVRPLIEVLEKAGVKLAETEDARMGEEVLQCLVDTGSACVHQYLPGVVGAHANLIVFSMTMANWTLKVYMLRMRELERLREEFRMRQASRENPPSETL